MSGFTTDEVKATLRNINPTKAAGPDKIHPRFQHHLEPVSISLLISIVIKLPKQIVGGDRSPPRMESSRHQTNTERREGLTEEEVLQTYIPHINHRQNDGVLQTYIPHINHRQNDGVLQTYIPHINHRQNDGVPQTYIAHINHRQNDGVLQTYIPHINHRQNDGVSDQQPSTIFCRNEAPVNRTSSGN